MNIVLDRRKLILNLTSSITLISFLYIFSLRMILSDAIISYNSLIQMVSNTSFKSFNARSLFKFNLTNN